jgi:hypothetical protein
MQTFILSFILLLIGCGSSSTESVAPCIVGSFGSNVPLKAFSADAIKNNKITDLEKQLFFREDGTGYYAVPAVKNSFPEFKVEFSYKFKDNIIDITAMKLFNNGIEMPSDGLGKDEQLLEKRLRFYKLLASLNEKTTCNCTKTGMETIILKTSANTDFLYSSDDSIFDGNQFQDVKSWVRRN